MKRHKLVGIDIKPHALYLVQLTKRKSSNCLEKVAVRTLPAGVYSEGKVKDWQAISHILNELVQLHHLHGAAAAICLPTSQVIMQRITLPSALQEAEIEAEILGAIKENLPDLNDRLNIDFASLTQDENLTTFFYTATRAAYLEQYTACLTQAGLVPKIIDVDIYALQRACRLASPLIGETHGIIVWNKREATLLLFDQTHIIFHQQWEACVQETDLLAHLRQILYDFVSTHAHLSIDALFVYGLSTEALAIPRVNIMEPLQNLTFADHIDTSFVTKHALDLLLAIGLAKREVPAW